MDKDSEKHKKQDMLDHFREKVKKGGNTVCFFGDIGSLKYSASQTLRNAIGYANKDSGWVRYKDVLGIVNENVEEKNKSNVELSEQQNNLLTGMKTMLTEFADRLSVFEKNQLTWKEIPEASNTDVDKMFHVGGNNLNIENTKPHSAEAKAIDYAPLKPAACVMLFFASIDNSRVTISSTLSGKTYQAGRNPLNSSDEPRELAKWEAAKDLLEEIGFIKQVNYEKTYSIYQVTESGFDFSDRFKEDYRFDARKAPHEILNELYLNA